MSAIRLVDLDAKYSAPSPNDKRVAFRQSETWETYVGEGVTRADRVSVVAHFDPELRIAVFNVRGERKLDTKHAEFFETSDDSWIACLIGKNHLAQVQRAAIELFDRAVEAQCALEDG